MKPIKGIKAFNIAGGPKSKQSRSPEHYARLAAIRRANREGKKSKTRKETP